LATLLQFWSNSIEERFALASHSSLLLFYTHDWGVIALPLREPQGVALATHRILAFCIRTRNFAFPCFPVLIFYGAPVGLWNILAAAAKVVHLLPLVPLRIQLGLAEVECLSRIRPIERSKLYVVRCFQCRPRGTVEVHLTMRAIAYAQLLACDCEFAVFTVANEYIGTTCTDIHFAVHKIICEDLSSVIE